MSTRTLTSANVLDSDDSSDVSEDTDAEIESILRHNGKTGRGSKYLVTLRGTSKPTWLPPRDIARDLLEEFKQNRTAPSTPLPTDTTFSLSSSTQSPSSSTHPLGQVELSPDGVLASSRAFTFDDAAIMGFVASDPRLLVELHEEERRHLHAHLAPSPASSSSSKSPASPPSSTSTSSSSSTAVKSSLSESSASTSSKTCTFPGCGAKGHYKSTCPLNPTASKRRVKKGNTQCGQCGEYGHNARSPKCPLKNKGASESDAVVDLTDSLAKAAIGE